MKARVIESALLATALIFPVVAQAQDVAGTLSDGVAENDIQVLKENTKEIEHVVEENAALAEGAEKSAEAEKTSRGAGARDARRGGLVCPEARGAQAPLPSLRGVDLGALHESQPSLPAH